MSLANPPFDRYRRAQKSALSRLIESRLPVPVSSLRACSSSSVSLPRSWIDSRRELPGIQASGDRRASRDAGRRYAELKPVVDAWRAWTAAGEELAEARELLAAETDDEMREYLRAEIADQGVRGRVARIADQGAAAPARPQRGPQRDRRDPGRRGRGGGEPLGRRPLSHVPALRREPRAQDRGALEPAFRSRWLPRRHLPREGRRRVEPLQVRGRPAPRAARSRNREPGAGAHERGDGRDPSRGRRGRRRGRSE